MYLGEFPGMDHLSSLKLLLITHGKCSVCKDKPVQHCGTCFNTGLQPEVLEAVTALDLAERLEGVEKRFLEGVSRDDYRSPPEGSYFHHVIEKKKRLEELYSEFMGSRANANQEKDIFNKLVERCLAAIKATNSRKS
jgi:hypothetical protein